MGITISALINQWLGTKKARILCVGLDAAGKTTILYRLKLGEVVTTIPTLGFNVETVKFNNISFTVWDLGIEFVLIFNINLYFLNSEFESWKVIAT